MQQRAAAAAVDDDNDKMNYVRLLLARSHRPEITAAAAAVAAAAKPVSRLARAFRLPHIGDAWWSGVRRRSTAIDTRTRRAEIVVVRFDRTPRAAVGTTRCSNPHLHRFDARTESGAFHFYSHNYNSTRHPNFPAQTAGGERRHDFKRDAQMRATLKLSAI